MTVRVDDFKRGNPSKKPENISAPQVWNFASAPTLHPMKVTVNVNKPGTAPGLIFVAPYTMYGQTMVGQTGILIMDQEGNPVWFRPNDQSIQNRNFRLQSFFGHPVLTLWQGTISGTKSSQPYLPMGAPLPNAHFQIINQNYRIIKTVTAQKGFTAGVHEFIITKRNTALFTAGKPVPIDLSPYGGPIDGYIYNYSIQEIDLQTGQLIFFWDALSHVDPADSMAPISSITRSQIWDCFHINSVEEGPDNTLLVSLRDMWAVYNIDKKTGEIIWQVGGKQNDFIFDKNAPFSWQHDARYRSGSRISLFDNACCATESSLPYGPSRGLILQLNYEQMTVEVDRTYYHDPLLYVSHRGNSQKLPNGNQFIGWGEKPFLSEFKYPGNTIENPSLNMLYDMEFPGDNFSYRAFKNEWIGYPLEPPLIAIERLSENSVIVYVSWNGSTETVAWQVLSGQTAESMEMVIYNVPRTGFETTTKVHSIGPYFQVNALNLAGEIIGVSRIVSR